MLNSSSATPSIFGSGHFLMHSSWLICDMSGVGAKVSQGCLLIHIPLESSNLLESFYRNGFNGGRPSIWALQVSCCYHNLLFYFFPSSDMFGWKLELYP